MQEKLKQAQNNPNKVDEFLHPKSFYTLSQSILDKIIATNGNFPHENLWPEFMLPSETVSQWQHFDTIWDQELDSDWKNACGKKAIKPLPKDKLLHEQVPTNGKLKFFFEENLDKAPLNKASEITPTTHYVLEGVPINTRL